MSWPPRSLLVAALLLVACRVSSSSPPPAVVVPSSAVSAGVVAPVASATASAPPVEESPPEEDACSDDRQAQRRQQLDRVRARAGAKREEVIESLREVLAVDPYDTGLREELARLLQAAGEVEEAGEEGEILVATGGSGALGWLLSARKWEARREPEQARVRLARAARLEPQGEAARALGTRSRCTALREPSSPGRAVELARGWREVFTSVEERRMVHEDKPEPTTEAEAKARACIHNDLTEITARGVCQGAGPWDLQTGHMHFHDHRIWVVPVGGGRFALVPYFTGGGCRGGSSVKVRVHPGYLQITSTNEGPLEAEAPPCATRDSDAMAGACFAVTTVTEAFYDLRTGAEVVSFEDEGAHEKLTLSGSKLRRAGLAGCDETIDLRQATASAAARGQP